MANWQWWIWFIGSLWAGLWITPGCICPEVGSHLVPYDIHCVNYHNGYAMMTAL